MDKHVHDIEVIRGERLSNARWADKITTEYSRGHDSLRLVEILYHILTQENPNNDIIKIIIN